MFAATDFEFKHRFWIFGAIFFVAFAAYNIDRQPAGVALTDWFARLRGVTANDADYRLTFGVAALLAVLDAAVRTWATAYLSADVMTAATVQTSRLVADGPYRYVRNPLYLGNVLLAIAFGMMASRIGCVILIVGMVTYVCRLILREEAGIVARQGDAYRAYCAAVPLLLPALRPKLPSAGGIPHWADGFLGEAFMWVLAASLVAFAVSLNQVVFFVVLVSSFVVYGICNAIIKRRRQANPNP
jgi:protein-S-isoprenylcysteine O-methyltransferase Ste14